MIASCAPISTGSGFLASLLRSLDCHAVSVAEQSFAFLGHGGSPAASILTAAMTIFIAIFGFRFMFGPRPDLGDATAAALKVGVTLALATSWPAVTSIIARPVLQGPIELAAWAGGGNNLPERLAQADAGIAALTSWGTGRNDLRAPRTANGDYSANATATVGVADSIAFGVARVSYLLTAIASVGIIRLLGGLLIGLAPVFAALLLFERTRGIFGGWARALFALLIAGSAVNVLLLLELSILEPWLLEVVRQRQAFFATPSAPTELMAMTLAFGMMAAGIIFLIFRLCLSLEIPPSLRCQVTPRSQQVERDVRSGVTNQGLASSPIVPERVLQTSQGIGRIDQYRSSTRLIGHQRTSTTSRFEGSLEHGLSRGQAAAPRRGGRATLIAQKRDSKA